MTLSKTTNASARVLEAIWNATNIVESLDLDEPGYQHFHAERLGSCVLAISHTYEQNGDLMRDPEIVFLRGADGAFYPLECRQDPMGLITECATVRNGTIDTYRPRAMRSVAELANLWMRNLTQQFPAIRAMVKAAA
jgi:hypothetical protein